MEGMEEGDSKEEGGMREGGRDWRKGCRKRNMEGERTGKGVSSFIFHTLYPSLSCTSRRADRHKADLTCRSR